MRPLDLVFAKIPLAMTSPKFSTLLSVALAAVPAMAQDSSVLDGLISTLEASNLNLSTTLAAISVSLNTTPEGTALINNISNGDPFFFFAPNDRACELAPLAVFRRY